MLKAIEQERRVELFSEWGHRWFDLKREPGYNDPSLSRADEVLGAVKTGWRSSDVLYPIPEKETLSNSNLFQNDGY